MILRQYFEAVVNSQYGKILDYGDFCKPNEQATNHCAAAN